MKRAEFFEAIEEAVARAEAVTAVEVVVALRHHSGRYRDVGLALALVGALTSLAWTVYGPLAVEPAWILPDALAGAAVLGLLPLVWPGSLRLLTSPGRRQAQVSAAAAAEFLAAGVHRTTGRTGLLVYASFVERRVELVVDSAVEAALPADERERLRAGLEAALRRRPFEAPLCEAIAALGPACAAALPRQADDVNELADAPRSAGL